MCNGHACTINLGKGMLISIALHLKYFHVSHPIAGGEQKKKKKNHVIHCASIHWVSSTLALKQVYFLPGINMRENERVGICKAKKYKAELCEQIWATAAKPWTSSFHLRTVISAILHHVSPIHLKICKTSLSFVHIFPPSLLFKKKKKSTERTLRWNQL